MASGQLVGTNVFFKGKFVELGFALNGSFGAGPTPSGYHPNPGTTLGMRYDWGHDGWAVGVPPAYGDYTTCGTPFEGWSIQLNGARADAFYTTGTATGTSFTGGLSGTFVSYGLTGSVLNCIWQGSCAGVTIMQYWTLDTNASWAIDSVVLTNTTAATINDAYYFRSLDPDAAQTTSGSYNTDNTVVYQNDAQHRVMVNSRGSMPAHPNAYLALAARDCRAKALIYQTWAPYPATSVSLAQIYNQTASGLGPTTYSAGASQNGDIAIGLVFDLGAIPPGGSVNFNYAYVFSNNTGIDSAFTGSTVSTCSLTPISGANNICIGQSEQLSSTAGGGIWSSNSSSVATISSTGVVTGVAAGTAVITYDIGGACCYVTHTVTVGVLSVSGPTQVCVGATINLSTASTGGTWTSTNTSVATVNSGSGQVAGIATGTSVISYTTAGGCVGTKTVTVIDVPPPITGNTSVCVGANLPLSNAFVGGTWSSASLAIATVNSSTGIVRGVAPGTAVIRYANSCGMVAYSVTVEPLPGPITGTVNPCIGQTSNLSGGVAPGTWSSSNSSVATVDTSGNVTSVSLGTSIISYRNNCGVATRTVTVIGPPPAIVGNTTVCAGGSLFLSNAMGGGTWSSSAASIATVNASTGVVSGVAAGSAVIQYINACGMATHTITIDPSPGPITGTVNPCVGQTFQLSGGVAAGTWSSSNSLVATVDASGNVGNGSIGTAIISYANNCGVATRTVSVTGSVPPPISGAGGVCIGNTLSLSNAMAGGTWSSGAPSVATIVTSTGVATAVAAGMAIITYSNTCGFATATVTVSVLDTISGPATICVGAVVGMSNATPGGVWSSSNPPVAAVFSGSGVVTGISAGTAVISYTANGCTQTRTVTVSNPPTAITGPSTVCVGNSVTLSSSPGGGSWFSGNVVVATVNAVGVVTGVAGGTTAISYSLGGACLVSRSITVTPITILGTGTVTVCTGNTVMLSNATGGGTWSSSNVGIAAISSGGMVTGVNVGTAIMSYALSSCTIYTTTVAVAVGPASIAGNNHICVGASTVFTNATAGGSWSISNSTVASISATAPGSITVAGLTAGACGVTYTMPGGCYTVLTLVVHEPPGAISGKDTVCAGASIMLSNAVPGGVWTSSASTVATVTAGQVTGVAAGQVIISYATVPVINGTCMATKTITVVPAPIVDPITGPAFVCMGDSIMLTNATIGGTWISSNPTVATVSDSGTVVAVSTGGLIVSYTINTTCGSVFATKNISVGDLPVAGTISGPDSVCAGSSIVLSDDEPGGVWSCVAGVATVSNTGVVAGLSVGTATISYTVTNACGSAMTTMTVTVNALPDAGIISGPDSLCKGADVVLSSSVTGGVWSSNNIAVATIEGTTGNMHVVTEGAVTISYTITSSAGCTALATHSVLVTPSLFGLGVVISPISCHGALDGSISTYITGTKPIYEYLWSTGAVSPDIANLGEGNYSLHVESPQTRCAIDTSFALVQPDSMRVLDSSVYDLCGNGTGKVVLQVSGGTGSYSFLWSTTATTKDLEQLHAGTYSVTVTDVNNCKEVHVATIPDSTCSAIAIHNVITPNGDGYNDVWVIEGIQGYPASTVQVFDKWGDEVFEQQGYQNDWGGQGKNGLLPDGTYYYLIKLNSINTTGGADTFAGYVMIKR